MKYGRDFEIATTTVITISKHWMNVFITLANELSMTSTSLLNLLVILPRGVVSKKDRGLRNTPHSMSLCKVEEALIVPIRTVAAFITTTIPAK